MFIAAFIGSIVGMFFSRIAWASYVEFCDRRCLTKSEGAIELVSLGIRWCIFLSVIGFCLGTVAAILIWAASYGKH